MTDISLDIDWIRHIPTFQIHEPINIHTYNAGGRIRVEIPRVIICTLKTEPFREDTVLREYTTSI